MPLSPSCKSFWFFQSIRNFCLPITSPYFLFSHTCSRFRNCRFWSRFLIRWVDQCLVLECTSERTLHPIISEISPLQQVYPLLIHRVARLKNFPFQLITSYLIHHIFDFVRHKFFCYHSLHFHSLTSSQLDRSFPGPASTKSLLNFSV